MKYNVSDITLAKEGDRKIEWARANMPLMNGLRERFGAEKPFTNMKISISIHLEAKTAYLAHVLREGGAEVHCTGCNPLSTQDAIAASLAVAGFPVYAKHGVDMHEYDELLQQALECKPDLILDDGGDLLNLLSGSRRDLAENVIGGTEETTTGVMRMRKMDKAGDLPFTMIAVNDARCKHLFDNRYGTGQSTWDSIMRNTNMLIAGKNVVVAGYGWCSRGIAARAAGLNARVIVTEVDPVRALEAAMDGCRVMSMEEAAKIGDIFICATGCKDVIVRQHLELMKDGVLLANAGHFDVEINKKDLRMLSYEMVQSRENIESYIMKNGRRINLIAEGRLVNLAAADGHPIEIMDMSFAVQALCLEYLAQKGRKMEDKVYSVPRELDDSVARLKVKSMGMSMDTLTREQQQYIGE